MNTKRFILALLVAVAASLAAAQQERTEEPQRREPGGPMRMLGLTKEQQAKVEDIHLKALKESEPLRAELQKQHAALKLELTAEKYNESKVKSIQSEISRLQGELGAKRFASMRAVREALTPEQQKKFDTHILSSDGPGGQGPGRERMRRPMQREGWNGMRQMPGQQQGRF